MTAAEHDTAHVPLIAKGHGAGDVLEAWKWRVLEEGPGLLVVECDLPEQLKNPQGQLFGGFTPTYVDFVAIQTVHTLDPESKNPEAPRNWMVTINMRCDYFEPIMGPTFRVKGEIINQRGLTSLVSTTFYTDAADTDAGETVAAYAITTLRMVPGVTIPSEPAPNGSGDAPMT